MIARKMIDKTFIFEKKEVDVLSLSLGASLNESLA
jgi:hypothetical protein